MGYLIYAPINTKLTVKYDLNSVNAKIEKDVLKDIYGYGKTGYLKK